MFTTIEKLQDRVNSYGAVLEYKDHVLVTNLNYREEFIAEIYEFIETPEEIGISKIECRLNLIKKSEENFEDSGSAILWCFENL
ncbi:MULTISPECIES: Nmad4 family putative nucleotide modification protein [Helcococcus]|uniref:Nucleotide modification associated domain-containing protein n=1 Tax=Helcococcus bovis TaxID=3153252 RepID=A0ABW9F6J9_9FIRM